MGFEPEPEPKARDYPNRVPEEIPSGNLLPTDNRQDNRKEDPEYPEANHETFRPIQLFFGRGRSSKFFELVPQVSHFPS